MSGGPGSPGDWDEVVDDGGRIDPEAYDALYARRLRPGFRWIEERARAVGQEALVTIPGLGCGQFAGPFRGPLGAELERALRRFLDRHGDEFPSVRTVVYDPYAERRPDRAVHGGVDFRVRPLTMVGHPQLSDPLHTEPQSLEFIVAWAREENRIDDCERLREHFPAFPASMFEEPDDLNIQIALAHIAREPGLSGGAPPRTLCGMQMIFDAAVRTQSSPHRTESPSATVACRARRGRWR